MPNQITPKQIKTLRRSFDIALIHMAINDFKRSFHLHPFYRTKSDIYPFLERKGIGSIGLFDANYKLIPWEEWKEILNWVKINFKKWIKDYGDCDNLAFLYGSLIGFLFEVNTCGVARKPQHVFNLILTADKPTDPLQLYVLEANKHLYGKWEPKEKMMFDYMTYFPITWVYYY